MVVRRICNIVRTFAGLELEQQNQTTKKVLDYLYYAKSDDTTMIRIKKAVVKNLAKSRSLSDEDTLSNDNVKGY